VGYSARNAEEWDHQLISALNAFDPIETTAAHVRRALQVQRLLAERSQRGRKLPDLLVAREVVPDLVELEVAVPRLTLILR